MNFSNRNRSFIASIIIISYCFTGQNSVVQCSKIRTSVGNNRGGYNDRLGTLHIPH